MTTPTASEPVTRGEFESAMARIDARFERLETRMAQFEAHLAQFEARFDVLRAQLETSIERAMVTSIRWTVGMILPLYAVLFGFMLFIVGREIPR